MTTLPRRSAIAATLTYAAVAQRSGLAVGGESADEHVSAGVAATEDLMREHGVLNRLMLVYEAAIEMPPDKSDAVHEVLFGAASLVRRFVEDYHGTLEEKYLFPAFDQRHEHADLIKTLREQHRVGRLLTGFILRNATEEGFADDQTRGELNKACRDFVRMFRAHEAWEDTVLFPAFRHAVSPSRLQELGEQFEEIEHREFGKDGFNDVVRHVARLEHHVGISGLDMFTARPQEQRGK